MSYGLKVFGDKGNIQIDENYRNLFLINKVENETIPGGKISVVSGFPSSTGRYHNGTVKYTKRNPNNYVAIRNNYNFLVENPKLMQVKDNGEYVHITNYSDTPQAVTIYEFGTLEYYDIPNESFGLQVVNSSNNIVFDSRAKPMRVVGRRQYSIEGDVGGSPSIVPNRKIAFVSGHVWQRPLTQEFITHDPMRLYYGRSETFGYAITDNRLSISNPFSDSYIVGEVVETTFAGTEIQAKGIYHYADFTFFVDVTGY